MASLYSVIFFVSGALLFTWMILQAYRGKRDLMCLRNLFLVGVIVFQFVSGGLSMLTTNEFFVFDPIGTGTKFYILLMIFLFLFLWSYERGWLVRLPAWRSAFPFPDQKPTTLLLIAVLFLVAGFVFRIVIGRNVPILGILTDIMAMGMLSGAAGLAAWAWAPRLWNPAIAIPAVLIILMSVVLTVIQTFGRRDVLSVMLIVLFAAYHSSWKYQGWPRLFTKLGIVLVTAVIFLAAFSTVRFKTYKDYDPDAFIQLMLNADVSNGLEGLAGGQAAANNSMWLMENRPPFNPLHSVIYTISQPIPREIWSDKPKALGFEMVGEGLHLSESVGYNVGPGLIGHIYNDNPWLALVPYAIFFGLLWRFFDEWVTAHPGNPFIVLPVCVGAGDLIGLPRGELGICLFRLLTAVFTAWFLMRFCIVFLRAVGGIPRATEDQQEDLLDPELAYSDGNSGEVFAPGEHDQDS